MADDVVNPHILIETAKGACTFTCRHCGVMEDHKAEAFLTYQRLCATFRRLHGGCRKPKTQDPQD